MIKNVIILMLLPAAIVQYAQWYEGTVKVINRVEQVVQWTK